MKKLILILFYLIVVSRDHEFIVIIRNKTKQLLIPRVHFICAIFQKKFRTKFLKIKLQIVIIKVINKINVE